MLIAAPNRCSARRLALVLAAALGGCDEVGGKAGGEPEPPPVAVSVVSVAPETLPVSNELPGRIAPTRIAEVRPRVSGIVVERVFEQGGIVRQGDVLYRIDPAPFRVRVDSAAATLRRAEASRIQARQNAERQTQLKERSIASAQSHESAVATLAQSEADVAVARAGLAAAELDLQYAEVRAPIAGRIGRARITEGALVAAADPQPLATIQQLDPVYADVTQSANELRALKANEGKSADDVRLLFDDGTEYAHRGRLLFSEAAVDASTGQVILRAEFANPARDLLPGMYVRVRIVQGVESDALAVPEQAVRRDAGGKAQLYVVEADGRAKLRPVEAGRIVDGRRVIAAGLKAGEKVIVEGFQQLRPDAAVDAQPWRPGASAEPASAPKPD